MAIKEVLEFADPDSKSETNDETLFAALLTISAEVRKAATPPRGTRPDEALEFLTVQQAAQSGLTFCDPIEFLSTTTAGTWMRAWSARTEPKTLSDLSKNPAAQWKAITGVDLLDFLALGWKVHELFKAEGRTRITPNDLAESPAPEAVDFLYEHCSMTVDQAREHLSNQREDGATLWARYELQQRPFLRLADGSLLPLRFQFAMQRIFGDHLFLETREMLKQVNRKASEHYASAMRDIFEERVAEVLARIRDHDTDQHTELIEEAEMKRAWRENRSTLPSICDFAVFRRHACVLIDANMRNLPRHLAEGSATYEDLRSEVTRNYENAKFGQLINTLELFLDRGWSDLRVEIKGRTRFVLLVVVPDAGLPRELTVENQTFAQAFPLVQRFNEGLQFQRVYVPAVIGWRDLLMLDGLAPRGTDIILLLQRWREVGPLATGPTARLLPDPLRTYVDEHHGGAALSESERRRGFEFFETLREHAAHRVIADLPPRTSVTAPFGLSRHGARSSSARTPDPAARQPPALTQKPCEPDARRITNTTDVGARHRGERRASSWTSRDARRSRAVHPLARATARHYRRSTHRVPPAALRDRVGMCAKAKGG